MYRIMVNASSDVVFQGKPPSRMRDIIEQSAVKTCFGLGTTVPLYHTAELCQRWGGIGKPMHKTLSNENAIVQDNQLVELCHVEGLSSQEVSLLEIIMNLVYDEVSVNLPDLCWAQPLI